MFEYFENNRTLQLTFNILAFSTSSDIKLIIFTWVLLMYLLAVLGNLMIMVLVCLVIQLQTPMYFFLCNLSVQDIIYVSAILPKLMAIIITNDTRISFIHCFTQIFVFALCVDTEYFLLATMAYDRYVAICIPLRYTFVMNKRLCVLLAIIPWLVGASNSMLFSFLISNLSFCHSKDLNHVFCDIKTVLKLSCNDASHIWTLMFVEGASIGLFPFAMTLISYGNIVSAICRIRTSSGRLKAFFSCSSHLTIVILYYGISLGLYMKPESEHSQDQDKLLSLLYIVLVPTLNPLVYSLRNKQVVRAMKIVAEKYILSLVTQ